MWIEVECFGVCCNVLMVQINDDYFEDLIKEIFGVFLDDLCSGWFLKLGFVLGCMLSELFGGFFMLMDFIFYDKLVVVLIDFVVWLVLVEGGSDVLG